MNSTSNSVTEYQNTVHTDVPARDKIVPSIGVQRFTQGVEYNGMLDIIQNNLFNE